MFTLIFLHVLGACVWAGGHLYLALGVLPRAFRKQDHRILQETEEMIERVAMPGLLVQIVTGLELARRHAGGFGHLFDMQGSIDHFAASKLLLLGLTIALAIDAHARRGKFEGMAWLRFMSWHVIAVTVLAVGLVALGVGFRTGTFFLD